MKKLIIAVTFALMIGAGGVAVLIIQLQPAAAGCQGGC